MVSVLSGGIKLVPKDNQLQPTGVFLCDGKPVSRSIVEEKRRIPTIKPCQCGYCGTMLPRGTFNCAKCAKQHAIPAELPYRNELTGRVWQANIPPAEKKIYPELTFPSGVSGVRSSTSSGGVGRTAGSAGTSVALLDGAGGGGSINGSLSGAQTVSTVSCEVRGNTPPKYRPDLHANPEWAGALVVFNYSHSPDKKQTKGTKSPSKRGSGSNPTGTHNGTGTHTHVGRTPLSPPLRTKFGGADDASIGSSAASSPSSCSSLAQEPLSTYEMHEKMLARKVALSKKRVDPVFAKFVKGEVCHPTGNFKEGNNRENAIAEKVHSMVLPKHKHRSTLERSLAAGAEDVRVLMQRNVEKEAVAHSLEELDYHREFVRTKKAIAKIEKTKRDAAKALTYGENYVDVENMYNVGDYTSSLVDSSVAESANNSRPTTGPGSRAASAQLQKRIAGRSTSPLVASTAILVATDMIEKDLLAQEKESTAGGSSASLGGSSSSRSIGNGNASQQSRHSRAGTGSMSGYKLPPAASYQQRQQPYVYSPMKLRQFGKQDAAHHFTQFDKPIIGMPKK